MKNNKGFVGYLVIIALIVLAIMIVGGGSWKLQMMGSSTDFSYTHTHDADPLSIGSKEFSAGPLEYICDDIGQRKVVYPEPQKECWKSKVFFDGEYYDFIPGRPVKIHEFITVNIDPQGTVYFDEEEDLTGEFKNSNGWKSTYRFEIDNEKVLSTDLYKAQEKIKLNSNQDFVLKINNNLYDFDDINAGAWVRTKHSLLERGETWETRKFSINQGTNNYLISPDTTELGKVQMEFQPFLEINADEKIIIRQSQPIKIQYEIVLQIADNDGNPDQVDENPTKLQKIIGWIKNNLLGWLY